MIISYMSLTSAIKSSSSVPPYSASKKAPCFLEVPGAAPGSTTTQLVAGGLLQLSRSRLGGPVPRPESWVSHGGSGTQKIAGLLHGKSEHKMMKMDDWGYPMVPGNLHILFWDLIDV